MPDQTGVLQRDCVAQASGMISLQADCTPSHAIVLMVTRGQETDRTLAQIASAVVHGEIRFSN